MLETYRSGPIMAKADQNNLRGSWREEKRQQRQEQPEVPGASGGPEDTSAEAATAKARKIRGKTQKHTSEDISSE
jgi:hypothetical protein